jgi:hypothetical protein
MPSSIILGSRIFSTRLLFKNVKIRTYGTIIYIYIFLILVCEAIGTAATLWRSKWNVDWQGKPKFSEKTCPSATFVHHNIPHFQNRV